MLKGQKVQTFFVGCRLTFAAAFALAASGFRCALLFGAMLRVGDALRFTGFTGVSVGYDVVCWFRISVCLYYDVWDYGGPPACAILTVQSMVTNEVIPFLLIQCSTVIV